MDKNVKILLRKGSIFILPILVWICIVLIVDPFNYFGVSNLISEKAKEKSAQKLNSLLYNSVNFKNYPTNSVIIGDSRIRKLPNERIKELTGDSYYTMFSNAAKLNEIIDLFWFCTEHSKLKNILIGINFNLYNEYAYANRVADVKEMIDNPLIYIFNSNIAETILLSLKNELFGINVNEKKDRDELWDYSIKTIAKNHYSKYKHPTKILERLDTVNNYCSHNNINLTILIVPHHKDFHDRLIHFGRIEEEKKFKNEIKNFGNIIDFDYPNRITNEKSCFSDPLHTTDSVGKIMVDEIFLDTLIIGKRL